MDKLVLLNRQERFH
jgi:hypothetical protein